MFRKEFKDRILMVYPPPNDSCKKWDQGVKACGLSMSKYVLEMVERGRTNISNREDEKPKP